MRMKDEERTLEVIRMLRSNWRNVVCVDLETDNGNEGNENGSEDLQAIINYHRSQ